jgi:hypothetical protein
MPPIPSPTLLPLGNEPLAGDGSTIKLENTDGVRGRWEGVHGVGEFWGPEEDGASRERSPEEKDEDRLWDRRRGCWACPW